MINVVNSITGSSEPYLYRGEDCVDVFTKKMIEVKNNILNKRKTTNEDIKMKEADWEVLTVSFVDVNSNQKIKHVETTAILLVSIEDVHDDCNLQFSMRFYKIPVFLHNLKNYDAHLIIEKAHKLADETKIDVIAQNSERFITFGFKNLCVKDSFSFLSSSLDKLVKLTKYEDGVKGKLAKQLHIQ